MAMPCPQRSRFPQARCFSPCRCPQGTTDRSNSHGDDLRADPRARTGGLITLSTSNSAVVSITPAAIHLPGGSTSATFTVTALSAGDFTISANYLGDSATTNLFVVRREPPPQHPCRQGAFLYDQPPRWRV